ncbi:LytR/AlgR family response regulator transcription factor [Acetivibrio ethanolgignens]|uniref:Stage 0 sporulation protein A homolog n=1 Tax=Acetivibrio ethanolgignens TaxID=290052 RepID=A0A0V8QEC9_9FIRM|nr:LytTR family DNA-binding domain-containing protein [Acetivibrio ethanolgignens]KSV58903.1 hypothetical protein ASU35_11160 [Acetivibrio ethanolgignens]
MRILILEDQTESRNALIEIIKSISEEIEVTAIASEKEAIAALSCDREYSLFLLDINLDTTRLSDTSGMNVARKIRKLHCYEFTPIVFVTSILSLELQSYRELQCYRYITKPFDRTEVAAIIEKVLLHSLEQREEASVTIKKDGINYKLSCDDILFIQAISRGVRLVLKTEELAVRYLTLKQLLPKLPQDEFLQCHRMYIVNQRYIEYVDTVNRMIKIRGSKEPVEIGVTYKTQIRSLLHE